MDNTIINLRAANTDTSNQRKP